MTVTNSTTGSSMSVPTADQTRLVIVGATGMVGGYALRYRYWAQEARDLARQAERGFASRLRGASYSMCKQFGSG
jgi:hypothetical protein